MQKKVLTPAFLAALGLAAPAAAMNVVSLNQVVADSGVLQDGSVFVLIDCIAENIAEIEVTTPLDGGGFEVLRPFVSPLNDGDVIAECVDDEGGGGGNDDDNGQDAAAAGRLLADAADTAVQQVLQLDSPLALFDSARARSRSVIELAFRLQKLVRQANDPERREALKEAERKFEDAEDLAILLSRIDEEIAAFKAREAEARVIVQDDSDLRRKQIELIVEADKKVKAADDAFFALFRNLQANDPELADLDGGFGILLERFDTIRLGAPLEGSFLKAIDLDDPDESLDFLGEKISNVRDHLDGVEREAELTPEQQGLLDAAQQLAKDATAAVNDAIRVNNEIFSAEKLLETAIFDLADLQSVKANADSIREDVAEAEATFNALSREDSALADEGNAIADELRARFGQETGEDVVVKIFESAGRLEESRRSGVGDQLAFAGGRATLGPPHGGLRGFRIDLNDLRRARAARRLAATADGAARGDDAGTLAAFDAALLSAFSEERFNVWADVSGSGFDDDGGVGSNGYVVSGALGASYMVHTRLTLGGALRVRTAESDGGGQDYDGDFVGLAGFASTQIFDGVQLDGFVAYDHGFNELNRDGAVSDFETDTISVGVAGGRRFDFDGGVWLRPRGALSHSWTVRGDFTDSAGVTAPGATTTRGTAEAGLAIGKFFELGGDGLLGFEPSLAAAGVAEFNRDNGDDRVGGTLAADIRFAFDNGGSLRFGARGTALGDDFIGWTVTLNGVLPF